MSLPVAILAGGLATRLRPLTDQIPKALVEVAGAPFVYHQLRLLAGQGVQKVVFCVGYRGEQIVEAVGDGAQFGIKVDYVFDGPALLGTGGALVKALPLLGDAFSVLYGDSYLLCDFQAVEDAFRSSGCAALMTVFRNDEQWDTSNVEFDGTEIVKYSKTDRNDRMRYIDYGLGILSLGSFAGRSAGAAFDLAALYEELASRGELAAFEVHCRFYEVGSLAGIRDLAEHLQRGAG